MFLGIGLLFPCGLHAGFHNGVESFDGTVIDTATWEVYTTGTASITQNDKLVFAAGNGGYTDVTSRDITVGVGQRARASLTVNSTPIQGGYGYAFLELATNSSGAGAYFYQDSYSIGIELDYRTTSFEFLGGVNYRPAANDRTIGRGRVMGQYFGNNLGKTYHLEVARTTLTNARFRLYDNASTLLSDLDYDVTNPDGRITPQSLFVTLAAYGGVAFDDVTISDVPEPTGTVAVIAAIMILLNPMRRRTTSKNGDERGRGLFKTNCVSVRSPCQGGRLP